VARADLAIFLSVDETITWSEGTLICSGPSGYSSMVQMNDTYMGILFENGAKEFSQQISFYAYPVN